MVILFSEKKGEPRSRADREADNQQLLLLEEKDVVSNVANVLSDLCGPGEWMPMAKLHAQVGLRIDLLILLLRACLANLICLK